MIMTMNLEGCHYLPVTQNTAIVRGDELVLCKRVFKPVQFDLSFKLKLNFRMPPRARRTLYYSGVAIGNVMPELVSC
jgi:hypothetical protein